MPPAASSTHRKYMELAISEMLKSRNETRQDGKVLPLVGAVLVSTNGNVHTAHRGELRDGDHAEFTLLERKNRDADLTGAVLYTTLEPCAPQARTPPKLSCAERINLARIKEVWVGIEDPDPAVDSKGIRFLEENGISISMFPVDLQHQIRSANKDFLKQALTRAAIVHDSTDQANLSLLENTVNASWDEIEPEALAFYRAKANLPGEWGLMQLQQRLIEQGLAVRADDKVVPTGYGIILFGKRPRDRVRSASMHATITYPNGHQELQDFDGPLVMRPSAIENWIRAKLPNIVDTSTMIRSELEPIPFEIVREAMINALIHSDYTVEGARTYLELSADRLVIKSAGLPVQPIRLEDMQLLSAPTLSRNPGLSYVFSQMRLVEERGLGMKTFREVQTRYGLGKPAFTYEPPYLVFTAPLIITIRPNERRVLTYLAVYGPSSSGDISEAIELDIRKTQRLLQRLIAAGSVVSSGRGKAVRYTLS